MLACILKTALPNCCCNSKGTGRAGRCESPGNVLQQLDTGNQQGVNNPLDILPCSRCLLTWQRERAACSDHPPSTPPKHKLFTDTALVRRGLISPAHVKSTFGFQPQHYGEGQPAETQRVKAGKRCVRSCSTSYAITCHRALRYHFCPGLLLFQPLCKSLLLLLTLPEAKGSINIIAFTFVTER